MVENKIVETVLACCDVDVSPNLVDMNLVSLRLLLAKVRIICIHIHIRLVDPAFFDVYLVAFYNEPFDLFG